jgi:stage IV sporulation protein FB
MDAGDEDKLIDAKPAHQAPSSSLFRTIISLAIFILVDYLVFKSWSAVFLLVSVIFLHELGHFIAMKRFGYQGVNMTFVPFMGAYVSGQATHFSKYKKIIMLLAGPLPGILIGMVLLFFYQGNADENYYRVAVAFLLLNIFNLLPVSPLDGGQFFETLFFEGNQVIQLAFLLLSLLAALVFVYLLKSWLLVFVAWFILIRIRSLLLAYRVRKQLDKLQISYNCSYEDLTDEHYAQIRDVLVSQSRGLSRRFSPGEYSTREAELIRYVEKVLMPVYEYGLDYKQKLAFLSVYLLAFILPLLQFSLYKGWL